ncbi:ATP-binding cassette domain-containing protein [Azospira sp. I13]|uniref:ATP-binding cassette domain-containing protein n=1 Tax=Azospira sp. I13 TaxID=1765050 RepID=UPI0014021641|nr:ATP-binding cassette domain-containing protein [Azospira sp. I13]
MSSFSMDGITQNNLKGVAVSGKLGEVVLVTGVSGSGKSTLVFEVIAAEARRQEAIRRRSDELYVYAVRPSFLSSTTLPECISVSQRALTQTEGSTFGTRSRLKGTIQKIFIEKGQIVYRGVRIEQPSLPEIRQFARRFHPTAKLYAVVWAYSPIDFSTVQQALGKHGIRAVFLRDEKKGARREIPLTKLPRAGLSNYEISVPLDACADDSTVLKLAKEGVMLLGDEVELNFDEHYFYLPDGVVFRKPSALLFSRSQASSRSGCCKACGGIGKKIAADFDEIIKKNTPLHDGFLDVPLTKSGRYVGFKFLPTGLSSLIKKQGIDTSKTFNGLSADAREMLLGILTNKLLSNHTDENTRQYLKETNCSACEGSGYSYQTRAVLVNGKSIDYFLNLTANELRSELSGMGLEKDELARLNDFLSVIDKLAIGHIGLNRPTSSISSGEAQRLKLLDVLMSNHSGKIIVLDEPSANLQYHDNLAILDAILKLKARDNCVIVVEHNPLYHNISDRILHVGPGAGAEGGYVKESFPTFLPTQQLAFHVKRPTAKVNASFTTLTLKPKRNVRLESIKIPGECFTAVVGSSGAGKSTLVLEMMYSSLIESKVPVVKLDSKPPGKSTASIVATYLEVFDDIRKEFSREATPYLTESDFSFNARGACPVCNGSGNEGGKPCGVCFGSRYKPDVLLTKVEGLSIVDVLQLNILDINTSKAFGFLSNVRRILDALSLAHITLGRATSSLSGGELQRLKLAKFILRHKRTLGKERAVVMLDEPSRGLDSTGVSQLYEVLLEYLAGLTVIAIEHNPEFIYRSTYIIDLGRAIGEKNQDNIVAGYLGDKDFPSLNYSLLSDEIKASKDSLQPIAFNAAKPGVPDAASEGRYFQFLPHLYIKQNNFDVERQFSNRFSIQKNDGNFRLFKSRDELQKAVGEACPLLFNPLVSHLEKFPKVPVSVFKAVTAEYKGRELYLSEDPWRMLVKAVSFDEAFLKGAGVVALPNGDFPGPATINYYGIRLFNLAERIVDGIQPDKYAFNLYRNACIYCKGYGHFKSYPFEKWIDKRFSPFDARMTPFGLNRVMPKATISHFAKEGLFDFSVPPSELTDDEYNILLYGFKAYKFQKPGKPGVVQDDFWEWRGLNSYVYHNAAKLSPREDLNTHLGWRECPFCARGFKKTVTQYVCDGKTIVSFLDS